MTKVKSRFATKFAKYLAILSGIVGLVSGASACTLAGKSLTEFDKTEFIFIGEVVGYSDSGSLKATGGASLNASGLLIKIKEKIFLPTQSDDFDVLDLKLMSDCSIEGETPSETRSEYPIGTEVRVIAKAPTLTQGASTWPRLEVRPDEPGQLVANGDGKTKKLTDATSVFDYKQYKFDIESSAAYYLLPNFELRKDLLRLEETHSQAGRDAILARLSFSPPDLDADFFTISMKYSISEPAGRELYERKLKREDPEVYEQYRALENVISELMKRGYSRAESDAAIGRAFDSGSSLSDRDFLDKCISLVKPQKP
jgi:hypothetical protein